MRFLSYRDKKKISDSGTKFIFFMVNNIKLVSSDMKLALLNKTQTIYICRFEKDKMS